MELEEYGKPRAEAWTRKALGAQLMLKSVETPVVPAATFTVSPKI